MTISPSHLAGRMPRLAARILDGFITGAPLFLLLPKRIAMGMMSEQLRQAGLSEEEITARIDTSIITLNFIYFAVLVGIACLALVILQLVFLAKDGQSLGKKVLKIRIVKYDTGKNGGFVTNVLLRTWLNGLISIVPFYGLVDTLFIFREDKRCIHDLLAGTSVVKA